MIMPKKEIAYLHVKDDIPYLIGDRNARSNRHRPVFESQWAGRAVAGMSP